MKNVSSTWQDVRQSLAELRGRSPGWLLIILEALRKAISPESSLTAAAISYFALFSFFPLILFTTIIAGSLLGPMLDRNEIIEQLDFLAPALALLLQRNLERIVGLQETLTGISIVTLIWASSNIFYVLTRTLDRIWGVTGGRSIWRHRGMALLSVLILSGVLLLASIVHSTVVSILSILAPRSLQPLGGPLSQLAAMLVSVLLFAVLYRYLPHADVRWTDIWPGALGAALLWEAAKRLFFFYATNYLLRSNLTSLIYGSLATIIGFLAWSYVSSLVFLFGAYLNVGYGERRKQEVAVEET
ncbi:MAG: YihY/virulence factor BrkB family protein [Chloroflexota bacterium]